jgi:diadenosine tetraphosphatase ApaH/serine/threonine PP2A family protein phosphatase
VIVAVLSDIHSNLAALDAVLASIGEVDAVWHLGDIVGYGPDPDAVVDRLREIGAIGVKGNHDDAGVALRQEEIAQFNPTARIAAEWTHEHISASTRRFLEALPLTLVPPETPFTLVHGSPRDPLVEYVFSPRVAAENLAAFATPYCLVGHTHVPLVFREGRGGMEVLATEPGSRLDLDERRAILNPGSVGQPRDSIPWASYAVLDTRERSVTWHRVPYDIAATQRAIRIAGLPAQLGARLAYGQ